MLTEAENMKLTLIGAGPGGYVAAIRAAQLGMDVTIVERDRPGGVCLNWGCIPTKALLKSAELFDLMHHASAYGLKAENISYDLESIVSRSRGLSDRTAKGVEYLLKKHKIQQVKGEASLLSPMQVQVTHENENRILESDRIVIATGARSRDLPGVQRDGKRIISSKEALVLKSLPKRLAVIGAGAIGMEFAYYFRCLGSEVTVIEALERALPAEDDDISKLVTRSFKKRKIAIETNARVKTVEPVGEGACVQYEVNGKEKTLEADIVLVAVGVVPNIESLGLETVGVEIHNAGITVNEHCQTNVPSIYAIGDVIGPPWLAHVASAEGVHAAEHIAGKNPAPIDYNTIPACTYCKPQAASIGYTEHRAKEEGIDCTIGMYSFMANGRAIASGETDGMVKLVFEKDSGVLIGGHIAGGEATEMIHELALAIRQKATAEIIGHTIHAHPTLGEAIMEAALDTIGERIHGA